MFDRCRAWRRQLSRRADGTLPLAQWGALENHLAHCARCQAADAADRALHEALGNHSGLPDARFVRAFDNRVIAALRTPGTPLAASGLAGLWARMKARSQALPSGFFTQVAGGALVAASLTILSLLSSVHPQGPVTTRSGNAARFSTARNEPPVPLESLLQSPSPRAALLWTAPVAKGGRRLLPPLNAESLAPAPALPAPPADFLPPVKSKDAAADTTELG